MENADDCGTLLFVEPERAVLFEAAKTEEKTDSTMEAPLLAVHEFHPWSGGYLCRVNTRFMALDLDPEGFAFTASADFPYASPLHFRIELAGRTEDDGEISSEPVETAFGADSPGLWKLEDFSCNGTYVNGQRVEKSCLLNRGDWIFAAGALFMFWNRLLLAPPAISDGPSREMANVHKRDAPSGEKEIVPYAFQSPEKPAEFELEAFVRDESDEYTRMPSPAGMMVISSLVSALSGALLNPGDWKTLGASLVGAGMSAAAFGGWYGWQGRKQKQNIFRKAQKTQESYLAYLNRVANEMEERRQKKTSAFQSEAKTLCLLEDTLRHGCLRKDWAIPAGVQFSSCITLRKPKISWQTENPKALEAVHRLEEMCFSAPSWSFLEPGRTITLSDLDESALLDLFLIWCHMVYSSGRRFAWIGFSLEQMPVHSACFFEQTPLCFPHVQAFSRFATLHPSLEWTICSRQKLFASQLPANAACIEFLPCTCKTSLSKPEGETAPIRLSLDRTQKRQKLRASGFGLASDLFSLPVPSTVNEPLWSSSNLNLRIELAPGVFWDLVQDGPHALVAGATGSGKSEGLSTLLHLLAWQNPPSRVQFILIDFKGGAFGGPLLALPHTAGLMTNLQAASIERMEKALENELNRRQKVIAEQIQQQAAGTETAPFPFSHLFICVDEFGQLKARCPEFMKSLQETARIGRSLGVHLILSTQKPAGLVDEQIWANSRSRLCFSVLDSGDSREVLGHDGAVHLKQPGEFILQVQGSAEKRGRVFYLKAPADQKSSVEYLDENGLWALQPRRSLQDQIGETIAARGLPHEWILCPDPLEEKEHSDQILIDEIHRTIPFRLPCGPMAMAGKEKTLRHALSLLVSKEERAVYSTLNFEGVDQVIAAECLDALPEEIGPAIFVLDDPAGFESAIRQIDRLPQKAAITLILVFTTVPYARSSFIGTLDCRILFDLADREMRALFLGTSVPGQVKENEAIARIQGEKKRLILGQKRAQQTIRPWFYRLPECRLRLKADEIEEEPGDLFMAIDLSSRSPLFYRGQKTTLIILTPAMGKAARCLQRRLYMQNPTAVPFEQNGSASNGTNFECLDLSRADSVQIQAVLQEKTRQGTVLLFGHPENEWMYSLGLRLPYPCEGNALWIEDGQVFDVQTAALDEP